MSYATGMRLVDKGNLVWATEPKNWTGAASTSDIVSLKNFGHATIIIQTGAWAGGTAAVTLNQAKTVAGGSSKALSFAKMWTNKAAVTSDLLTETAVVSDTFNLDTANAMYVIEVDAASLDLQNDFDCLQLAVASPGANADIYGAIFVLQAPNRYAGSSPPSAIVD